MGRKHGRRRMFGLRKEIVVAIALVLVIALGAVAAHVVESQMSVPISNAGEQVTAHTTALNTAQVFVDGQWYAERNVDTLLLMGIDNYDELGSDSSYNNTNQTDFLALYVRDQDSGRTSVLHLNRDTMTKITTLGVTGQVTGSRTAQLALAYNYGSGDHISSNNVVEAVEHLLYGIEVDHYITVTMGSVPIVNDWTGGVTVMIKDDFSNIDPALVQGEYVKLSNEQALTFIRARGGLDDSSNLSRMERQREYASAWVETARTKLADVEAVADLLMQMDGYYRTDCTVEELEEIAQGLSNSASMPLYELEGKSVKGEDYMEYHVNEKALQQLVLELFYAPVGG